MTGSFEVGPFYVSVSAEADEQDLVADIVYLGQQVADVRRVEESWTVTLYDPFGAEGFSLPLEGLRTALDDAAQRLRAR